MKGAALHEARQWVVAATLRGGVSREEEAQHLLRRMLAIQGDLDAPRRQMHERLHHVYGADPKGPWLPALEPDLLGEAMVLRVAAGTHGRSVAEDWIERVLGQGAPPAALQHGMTVLGRAMTREEASPLRAWMSTLLSTDLATRAPRALEAAKAVGQRTAFSPLGDVLAERLEASGDPVLAGALESALPNESVSLQRVAVWVATTLHSAAPTGDGEDLRVESARRASNLGVRLIELGRREEALAPMREAMTHYRILASSRPDAFLPYLATSLNNLGNGLSESGRPEDALTATQEAVELHRTLVKSTPSAFIPELATSLNNLGNRLSELGRREDALTATQEAVDYYSTLAKFSPDVFLPDLAVSLNNLGNRLGELGRHEDALRATQGAVALRRTLAKSSPDTFLPYLAGSLNNLGNSLRGCPIATPREIMPAAGA